jgi:hypothetical protein
VTVGCEGSNQPQAGELKMASTELKQITDIGSVVVHRGNPPNNNPFRGFEWTATEPEVTNVSGRERKEVLRDFKNGHDTSGYTFWYLGVVSNLCYYGLADRRITDPAVIDWSCTSVE